jgi:hypothetical protein
VDQKILLSWKGQEGEYRPKQAPWYWAIGIAAGGIAVSAALVSNYLFALIALLGGFAIMVVGSRRPLQHVYKLTDRGVMIGVMLIPYEKITRFAIRETEPQMLVIETTSITGTTSIPLLGVDWRTVRTEFKNRNIEEAESLGTFIEAVERALGL